MAALGEAACLQSRQNRQTLEPWPPPQRQQKTSLPSTAGPVSLKQHQQPPATAQLPGRDDSSEPNEARSLSPDHPAILGLAATAWSTTSDSLDECEADSRRDVKQGRISALESPGECKGRRQAGTSCRQEPARHEKTQAWSTDPHDQRQCKGAQQPQPSVHLQEQTTQALASQISIEAATQPHLHEASSLPSHRPPPVQPQGGSCVHRPHSEGSGTEDLHAQSVLPEGLDNKQLHGDKHCIAVPDGPPRASAAGSIPRQTEAAACNIQDVQANVSGPANMLNSLGPSNEMTAERAAAAEAAIIIDSMHAVGSTAAAHTQTCSKIPTTSRQDSRITDAPLAAAASGTEALAEPASAAVQSNFDLNNKCTSRHAYSQGVSGSESDDSEPVALTDTTHHPASDPPGDRSKAAATGPATASQDSSAMLYPSRPTHSADAALPDTEQEAGTHSQQGSSPTYARLEFCNQDSSHDDSSDTTDSCGFPEDAQSDLLEPATSTASLQQRQIGSAMVHLQAASSGMPLHLGVLSAPLQAYLQGSIPRLSIQPSSQHLATGRLERSVFIASTASFRAANGLIPDQSESHFAISPQSSTPAVPGASESDPVGPIRQSIVLPGSECLRAAHEQTGTVANRQQLGSATDSVVKYPVKSPEAAANNGHEQRTAEPAGPLQMTAEADQQTAIDDDDDDGDDEQPFQSRVPGQAIPASMPGSGPTQTLEGVESGTELLLPGSQDLSCSSGFTQHSSLSPQVIHNSPAPGLLPQQADEQSFRAQVQPGAAADAGLTEQWNKMLARLESLQPALLRADSLLMQPQVLSTEAAGTDIGSACRSHLQSC